MVDGAIRYGATLDEWMHWGIIMGMGERLLPVVSNPHAKISPKSAIKSLGKLPSQYNRDGLVVGFSHWTRYIASSNDLDKWRSISDYGICLKTELERGIDIDVKDPVKSRHIRDFIERFLGRVLAWRVRKDSGKILGLIRVSGLLAKRVLKVNGGIIEFLANGQQCVIAGTHVDGSRYEWDGGLPLDIVEITIEQFDQLWMALDKVYGDGTSSLTGSEYKARADKIVGSWKGDHALGERDMAVLGSVEVLGRGSEGEIHMVCPFADGHSMEGSISATTYMLAGSRGYDAGFFKCLHGSCSGRSQLEFIDALDLRRFEFEHVVLTEEEKVIEQSKKEVRKKKNLISGGNKIDREKRIAINLTNIRMVLENPELCKIVIRYDNFKDEIVYRPVYEPSGWRSFEDTTYTDLRYVFEEVGFKMVSRDVTRDVVHGIAKHNSMDSAMLWLNSLEWDGISRINSFFVRYFGAEDCQYTAAVSRYVWSALAGRVLEPGCKADMVPVLISAQGAGKTYGVSELVPSYEYFESINLMERDGDLARRMRGKLVIEIGELRGLHSRDMESIKEFITRRHESWVPKYKEFAQKYARRSLFIGTTNQEEFLADTTGNRRWLPVRCGNIDIEQIKLDRLQLWAEAKILFEKEGVHWQEAQELGSAVHEQHRIVDSWKDIISDWLNTVDDVDGRTRAMRGAFTLLDVMREALQIDPQRMRRCDEMRVNSLLRELNYVRTQKRIDGVRRWVWESAVQ